jgi:Putative beta-lactamase-inhibitor-like, PepSY-like
MSMTSLPHRAVINAAILCFASTVFGRAATGEECPTQVKAAVEKAHSAAKLQSCKREKENGQVQYEVKLEEKDGEKLEIDVAPDGTILQTEEKVSIASLPAAVSKAFATKYPGANPKGAEKQTHGDGKISYEIAFETDKGREEATFSDGGKFMEEESWPPAGSSHP